MIENDKKTTNYINELEDKVVDLSLQLKAEKNKLCAEQVENYERIRKLVHNLKNPIGVAYSFSEMITDAENLSSEKLEKYINVIKSSAKFSIDNLNAIANLNRLKSPNFSLNIQKIHFSSFINGIIEKHDNEAVKKGISIVKTTDETDLNLNADPIELKEVFNAILGNAIRYSPNNSTIQVDFSSKDNGVEIKIKDQGIGISKENLPKIFDEFFVVNTYSDDTEKCIGLGLSTSKIIVEKHQGKINIYSVLDTGVEVSVFLPNR